MDRALATFRKRFEACSQGFSGISLFSENGSRQAAVVLNTQKLLLRAVALPPGPYSLEALQEMASAHAFTEEAYVAQIDSEQWIQIRDLEDLRAILFPPTRKLNLKTKIVRVTDKPGAPDPITVEAILQESLASSPTAQPMQRSERHYRNRDFWIATLCLDLCVVGIAYGVNWNPLVSTIVGGVAVVANLGMYWAFYHIMEPY